MMDARVKPGHDAEIVVGFVQTPETLRGNAMSHAEAVHTLQPAAGATDQIVQFAGASPTTRCRRTPGTTRGGICSTPSA